MKITMTILLVLLASTACRTTPTPPPGQVAEDVAVLLAAGDVAKAEEAFRLLDDDGLDTAFGVLFARGREMAEQRDYGTCIRVNRFLVAHYPRRPDAREALLFALWLERARTGKPHDAATIKEMRALGAAVRTTEKDSPVWVDLALAQVAIDAGDLDAARAAMARFHARWNGHPASLGDYALEVDRWLASHTGA
ncbi:MAG: hypothetical protein ABFS86_02135 [Planctomycetota bacterium]